ncbi:hypothetical protein E4631_15615 [Hymenobacter sp. UV11]|uniref:hypothetical protein n=1 Tax=Hymenobacter sp. UV11 TaxID=1849735 RepID=UPI0010608810|nr:hypothetical protein [Hymenobacter sp. UV11]TDN39274.1 hypothetical protein A8B98_18620 [Hymenobacter sp. UV11]TFZ65645.1 hypothetical protein E4631_15615 [Hymenobacter sp. UV11]
MLQLPELRQEQPARDEAEAARLTQLAQLMTTTAPLPDLRDLAPAVRQLFPEPTYEVGCGGSHIWLHRADDPRRLACILDHYQ